MSDIGISPEDRERLAKSKFGEWFDEFFDKKFAESFEKANASRPSQQRRAQLEAQGQTAPPAPQHEEPKVRRRSLLEECFSQTFGWG